MEIIFEILLNLVFIVLNLPGKLVLWPIAGRKTDFMDYIGSGILDSDSFGEAILRFLTLCLSLCLWIAILS